MVNIGKNVDENAFLVSKTDTKGRITYCNVPFIEIVGTKESELLGKPHNIVRHPDMPKVIFKLLWEKIMHKQEIFAYVKNRSFDGGFYWVFANITASLDEKGSIIGYYSVRRKVNPKALSIIEILYKQLLDAEKSGGIKKSEEVLNEILKKENKSYGEFVNNLQRL